MNMYGKVGEFTPDSLIAGNEYPILKEGIGLKAGQGLLKRGTLISKAADGAGYITGKAVTVTEGTGESAKTSDVETTVFGILTDDTDTGSDAAASNIPATAYITGIFSRADVIVAEGANVDAYEHDMKVVGMYLRRVQEY